MIFKDGFIWAMIWGVCTFILYIVNIRQTWQNERKKRGLAYENMTNPPRFYTKYIYGDKIYFTKCFRLGFSGIVISSIIFLGCMIISPIYSFEKDVIKIIKIFISILCVYLVLGGIIKKEDFKDSESTEAVEKFNKFDWIIKAYTRIKKYLIMPIIDDEYTEGKKYIENRIDIWHEKNKQRVIPTKVKEVNRLMATEVEVFICSLNKFITDNVDLDSQEEGLVERYEDLLLDLYQKYINRDTSNLISDIHRLIDKIILKGFNIELVELILHIKRLDIGNKKYSDIINQMKSELAPVNSNHKSVQIVSEEQFLNMFRDRNLNEQEQESN